MDFGFCNSKTLFLDNTDHIQQQQQQRPQQQHQTTMIRTNKFTLAEGVRSVWIVASSLSLLSDLIWAGLKYVHCSLYILHSGDNYACFICITLCQRNRVTWMRLGRLYCTLWVNKPGIPIQDPRYSISRYFVDRYIASWTQCKAVSSTSWLL